MTAPVPIPEFQLYGEAASFADPGFVHIETVASRSGPLGGEIRAHVHATLDQLLIVRDGTFAVTLEVDRISLAGPAVVHVPASTVHGFDFAAATDGHIATFSADLRSMLVAMYPGETSLPHRPAALSLKPASAARLDLLTEQLLMECSGHERGWSAGAGWLVGLMLQQVGRLLAGQDEQGPADRRQRFRELVDRHFREHRSIAFYAEAMGMTERSLTRLCRAAFRCSPTHYLHRRLLLEAKRQLLFSTASIARIGEELGFSDPSYFNRFYRRLTGERPSAARR